MFRQNPKNPEFSIVMPCLNEEKTIGKCINKTKFFFEKHKIGYEIVIADNGSTDKSVQIAERGGVKIIHVKERGYGSALQQGIKSARGKYIIMGDADNSYDFSDLSSFVVKLRQGYDFVIGNRFSGQIMPGAMPWQNKLIGNPALSYLGRLFFKSNIGDFYCGLRSFSKKIWENMDMQSTGMEYAAEMVIKATVLHIKISEVPITYYKDGRSGPSNLKRWRDGWRGLRFLLLFSPRWLFMLPGLTLLIVGGLLFLLVIVKPVNIFGVVLDLHTLLISTMLITLGFQIILFSFFTETLIINNKLLPTKVKPSLLIDKFSLEHCLVAGLLIIIIGLIIFLRMVQFWYQQGFGPLNYVVTMRHIIPSVFLIQLGVQIIFNSFYLSMLVPKKIY